MTIDSAEHAYAADAAAAVAMNQSSMVIDMNPGGSVTMKVPFDVPAGTLPTVIELHDSAFSEGARVQVTAVARRSQFTGEFRSFDRCD